MEGGERTGNVLSIIATCIAHDVNPRAHLHLVVHRIVHGWPQAKLRDLLPDRMLGAHPELYIGDPDALPMPVVTPALPHDVVAGQASVLCDDKPATDPGPGWQEGTKDLRNRDLELIAKIELAPSDALTVPRSGRPACPPNTAGYLTRRRGVPGNRHGLDRLVNTLLVMTSSGGVRFARRSSQPRGFATSCMWCTRRKSCRRTTVAKTA